MTTIYERSLASDFKNSLNEGQFHIEIEEEKSISTPLDGININSSEPDKVNIVFLGALTSPEEIKLDEIISAHVPRTNIPGATFDAVVDASGKGQYLLPSAAFAAGHLSVFVRNGLYIETTNIVLPDFSALVGESGGGVQIYFAGTASGIIIDASGGVKETVGTIGISQFTKAIVGVGTTFTHLNPGDYILIGTNYYGIASIEDDTNLTLGETYVGKSVTNFDYIAQTMYTGIHMSRIFIIGSAAVGLYIRACRHFFIDSVALKNNASNIQIVDCGDSSLRQILSESGFSTGMIINECVSMSFSVLDIYNNMGNGLEITNRTESMVFNGCEITSNQGNGIIINGSSTDTALNNIVIKYNSGKGIDVNETSINFVLNNSVIGKNGSIGIHTKGDDIIITNCVISDNGTMGICVDGNHSHMTNIISKNNTDGIRIKGSDCILNCSNFRNNSLDGIHIEVTATDTIVTTCNSKNNGGTNISDNGITSSILNNKS